ncbi:hypothetical protein [Streptomyces sp. NPDC002550]
MLDEHPARINSARLEGRGGDAPLHRAAWHGASADTVGRLLEYGGWRTLRAADGTRAVDIAAQRRHQNLTALLRPDLGHPLPPGETARLQEHLHRLIRRRAGLDSSGVAG